MATSSPFDDSRLRSLERERERYEKERTHQHDDIEKLREVFERDTERLRERFKRDLNANSASSTPWMSASPTSTAK